MWFLIPNKPQSNKAGRASPAFRQIGESGSRRKTNKAQMIKGNRQGQAGPLATYQCGEIATDVFCPLILY
ncbi:hypothetical protein D7Y06_22620 [Roseburia sp. 1XD42-69]|nr:hypothetical protein D7Y06_22620 [Roseburia sp. 1XD42-69]